MSEPIRVLVVDDQEMMRAGLIAVLTSDEGIEVVGQAGDGAAAVREAARLQPDVVLLDVEMPGGVDGITALSQLTDEVPAARVIILTTFDIDEYVLGALQYGASGFLIKTTPPRDLILAVKECAAGGSALGPTIVRRLVQAYIREPRAQVVPALADLTHREREVLRVMAAGLSNAEIGTELYLAETTVRTHVGRILTKLGVRDRVQAVILAHRAGLV